ncbi:MAG: Cell division protein SepF [Chroococcopsis gigantea SAG 12.99]|jgi:cell division inhibitor SepF|nr:cell division protein SepF [Chlorogloea purpurea SAG 13.99]MDV2999048.1 Cell division protein SepF [Chroococcopsis gigantea SAG 12.99]
MNNLFTKLKDFVGISEQDEDDEIDYEEVNHPKKAQLEADDEAEEEESAQERHNYRRNREPLPSSARTETSMGTARNNVIGMPGIANSMAEVVVIEPHSFEEMPKVIQTLRDRKSVVLNLNVMDPEEAQRAVDFVAGGTFAIDGHQERIGESIFLFTPSCVKVSTLAGSLQDLADGVKAGRSGNGSSGWGVDTNKIAMQ